MSNLNLLVNADANLILTGYTGPNEPLIGRMTAERLKRRFVNVEARLEEHAGMSLDEIRSQFGQATLKNLESEIISEILLYRGAVIRISGETLSHADNLARLTENGSVVCMVASLGAVLRKMHLSMGARFHNPAERDLALGELRRAWFARGKPNVYEVDVTALTEDQTIETLTRLWQTLALQRG